MLSSRCLPTRSIWCDIHLVVDNPLGWRLVGFLVHHSLNILRSNTRSNEVHLVASWSTLRCAPCTSWCHSVYFITSRVTSQKNHHRVIFAVVFQTNYLLCMHFYLVTRFRIGFRHRESGVKKMSESQTKAGNQRKFENLKKNWKGAVTSFVEMCRQSLRP